MTPISFALTVSLLAAPGLVADVTYAVYYVSAPTGSDATGEGSPSSPWASMAHAIEQASAAGIKPATINVAGGIYEEKVTVPDRVALCGGYDPEDWERDLDSHQSKTSRFTCHDRATLDGFRIIGRIEQLDRGVVCSGTASVSVRNCIIEIHAAPIGEHGGGIRMEQSASAQFTDCVITDNGMAHIPPPSSYGGGIWHGSDGTLELIRCHVVKNLATHGGAIYAERGSVVCRDCTFTHNSASWGASIHAREAASVTLINCRFTDNVVFESSVGRVYDLYTETENCTMINCTLAGTIGSTQVAHFGGLIRNSILRGGSIAVSGDITYSNIQGYQFGGTGNIDVDPLFVSPAEEDYRLQPSSPCIDTGTSTGAPDHDLDGNPRPVDIPARGFDGPGQGYDMGCYEYFPSPTPTPTHTPGPTPTPIDVDLNGDGKIDELDLFLFSREWQRGQ